LNCPKTLVLLIAAASVMGFAGCADVNEVKKCGLEGCADDRAITANVEAKLSRHAEVGTRVHVQTLDHIVYLDGFVSSGLFSDVAEDVARTVPGVTRVVNSIAVTK
jgi:osmotically-inducible protein OsmY